MPAFHLESLQVNRRRGKLREALWREWCFARVLWRSFRWRLAVVIAALLGGGSLFRVCEGHEWARSVFYSWSLIFGQPPEIFPDSIPLRVAFFALPVIGLVFIIDGIVELAAVLRDRRRFEKGWCLAMASSMSGHIILVGLGRLGFRIYSMLRKLGESVVVIERTADSQFIDAVRRDGSPIILGDARNEDLLVEANIAAASALIIATNDDLANLEIALDARRLSPHMRIVLRMFDQNLADKVRDGFNIRLAMSQSAISAPTFAMTAIEPSIVNTFRVGDRLLVMQHWFAHPGGPLERKTIAEIGREYGFHVVERRPELAEPQLFPAPDTRILAGDKLLVQGPFETMLANRRRRLQLT
ncbi:MAG: NAD(P)-binding protein [Phycisphaerae bacterium]